MRMSLLCLPLCLLCISDSSSTQPPPPATFRDVADNGNPLPRESEMERLARTDPIAFLEACIRRYDREVKGFEAILIKKERIDGKIEPSEVIDVAFRESPFSVLMKWKEGARKAAATLYVKGENRDQLLVRPNGVFAFAGIVTRDPNGTDAKKGGRYPLTEFGIKIGMQRALASWKNAAKEEKLHVEYLGIKRLKEAGDRPCYVLRRTGYAKAEEDGVREFTMYVDKDTWLQIGSILKGKDGKFIASYFFRDVKSNPDFKDNTFTREALRR